MKVFDDFLRFYDTALCTFESCRVLLDREQDHQTQGAHEPRPQCVQPPAAHAFRTAGMSERVIMRE